MCCQEGTTDSMVRGFSHVSVSCLNRSNGYDFEKRISIKSPRSSKKIYVDPVFSDPSVRSFETLQHLTSDAYLSWGGDELGILLDQGEVHLSDQFHVGDDLCVAKVDEPDSHLLNLAIFSPLDPATR